ncbi:SCAN domain-containing protein 3 [Nephila pilipes]|uniref:SCAN domain-containing protein 3 n=1 Tax=Nephila pilipes TaxID=299642 RepID=A0A8X6MY15_NEPPI|nr:SCAN domain-containing protein 3 [Nephila pilipes]
MVPSKLKRHLYSSHPSCANKDKQYFKRCLEQNKNEKKFMKSAVTVSEKALEASYHVAKLIARQKKPHTVGETLIKAACMEIVRLMLGPNEVKEVNKVSLSADTVKRRIHDMSSDILGTLIKKLLSAEKFALQIDETTDIKNKAQLIAICEKGIFLKQNIIQWSSFVWSRISDQWISSGNDELINESKVWIFREINDLFFSKRLLRLRIRGPRGVGKLSVLTIYGSSVRKETGRPENHLKHFSSSK